MNSDRVPTAIMPSFVRFPPSFKTRASAMYDAKFSVDQRIPRYRDSFTETFFMDAVCSLNSVYILSSVTSVFIVLAPVIPSLNVPVMREFVSLILRLAKVSLFCMRDTTTVTSGTSASTMSVSFTFVLNITISAPIMYEPFQRQSRNDHDTREPILPVSLITLECM